MTEGRGALLSLRRSIVKRRLRFAGCGGIALGMGNEASTSREERLAAKLRENLRRRKAQARALGARVPDDAESGQDGAPASSMQENESGRLSKSAPES